MNKTWKIIQANLDISGGAILGLWSLMMLALSCFCVVAKRDMPSAVASSYGIIVGAYAVTRTFKKDSSND